ncbi:MAG: glycosyltransferase family A protein [Alphaproteobacteria bacterium]
MSKITLSIVLSNYNHGHFLKDTLLALLQQSWAPDEIVLFDDASTDSSREVIAEIAARYPCVHPMLNEKNVGPVVNANLGLKMATGDYVYCAAADDRVLPGFFETSMKRAEARDSVGIICSDPVWFYDGEQRMWVTPMPFGRQPAYFSPADIVQMQRVTPFNVAGHTSILNRRAALKAGGMLPELKWHCDWFMNFVVAFRHGIEYVPEPLSALRVAAASYSASQKRTGPEQQKIIKALADLLAEPDYADVRQAFVDSTVLADLGVALLEAAREDAGVAELVTQETRRRVVKTAVRKAFGNILPNSIKAVIKNVLGQTPKDLAPIAGVRV